MLFSSITFIAVFLPAVSVLYYALYLLCGRSGSHTALNIFLLVVSLLFYGFGEPRFVFVLLLSILGNYAFALCIARGRSREKTARGLLACAVALNLALLFVYKYLNFFTANIDLLFPALLPQTSIVLPIGISFFTFQAISYVVDVYRGHGDAQKNPLNVGLYISFFPQLIAGPIVRYETIAEQLNNRKETISDICAGLQRFAVGLCKKVLLSNALALIADKAYALQAEGDLSVSFAWLGAVSYMLQIYYDFSGYSDMAIGMGWMFGFHFDENFNYPYIARSITDFWRRWHISLSTWFRDYVYIPLGGSRVSGIDRHIFNLFVVWLLTGFWHGAQWTFVAWGLFYFVLLVLEKFVIKPERFSGAFARAAYRAATLLFVMLALVIFRAESLPAALSYQAALFGLSGVPFADIRALVYLRENWAVLLASVLFCMPVAPLLSRKQKKSTPPHFYILYSIRSARAAVPALHLAARAGAV